MEKKYEYVVVKSEGVVDRYDVKDIVSKAHFERMMIIKHGAGTRVLKRVKK